MSAKSDTTTSSTRRTLVVGALLVAATVQVALAALSDSSNQQLPVQMLTNDKAAQVARYQIIANDLSGPSDLPSPSQPSSWAQESTRRAVSQQQQQQQQQRQQQQQQQQQQNPQRRQLMNGNLVWYVEPPADFKPIIYDYDASQVYHQLQKEQQQQQQQQQQPKRQPTSADSGNQVGDGSIAGNKDSQEQQRKPVSDAKSVLSHHLHVADYDSPMSHDGPIIGSASAPSSSAAAPSSQLAAEDDADDNDSGGRPLKPSIGRWNDWHDMSSEPDLASSDTSQPASVIYAAPARSAPAPAPASASVAAAAYPSTRYNGFYRGSQASQPETGPFFFDEIGLPVAAAAAAANLDHGSAAVAGRDIQAPQQQQRQAFAVKRPIQQQQQQQQQRAAVKGGQASKTGQQQSPVRLALNLINSSSKPTESNIEGEQQQANHLNQVEPSSGRPNLSGGSAHHQLKHPSQKFRSKSLLQSKTQQQQQQPRLKRRRKSKTNAEVRIQQLQHQPQPQPKPHHDQLTQAAPVAPATKQVNVLMPIDSRSQYRVASKHALQQQSRVLNSAAELLAAANSSASLSSTSAPSAAMLLSSPPVVAAAYQPAAGAAKRVLRRRKIKSQLPVGLSSWFLGGIRDLEGRHWNLPGEVVGRLAVNDVELSHPGGQTPQPVSAPAANSVVLLDSPPNGQREIQSDNQQTSPAPQAVRVPINHQLIPR